MELSLAETLWGYVDTLFSFGKAAFGLGIVIFVHELGHFLVAKACGVKCEKFYIGFDVPISIFGWKLPSALWRKQWGETEYGIGVIPLGGYVKMLGQDDNPANSTKEAERIRVPKHDTAHEPSEALDPRSYPAKSVPQRMAIISAGVVMNIIFAVVFAMVAYRMGVKYLPCELSSAAPGSPAWRAGIRGGDKIVQIGKEGQPDEQLSWERDLIFAVHKTMATQPLDILVRHRDGAEEWLGMQPRQLTDDAGRAPKIGATPPFGDRIVQSKLKTTQAARSELLDDDKIVSLTLDGTGESIEVKTPYDVLDLLAQHPETSMTLTVERPSLKESEGEASGATTKQTLKVVLAPQPLRGFGLWLKFGPIVAIREKSPAQAAGFRVGDELLAVRRAAIEDPLLLADEFRKSVGQDVVVRVRRESDRGLSEEVDLTVRPEPVRDVRMQYAPGYQVPIESIGIAFDVLDTINSVVPESPADKAGLVPNDELIGAKFKLRKGAATTPEEFEEMGLNEIEWSNELADAPRLFSLIQQIPSHVDVELSVRRGGKLKTVVLGTDYELDGYYHPARGLLFEFASAKRTAKSWSEAFSLGLKETKAGIGQVLFILRNIGEVYQNVGGPLMIATVGTEQARAGISKLLIFLTLLSANLAVLNALPIPVLDGGHMLFLIYEGLFGKPANERIVFGLTMAGLCFLLTLMVFVFGADIYRISRLIW